MTGVPRELAEHALQIIPGSKPVRQAMRCFGDEKRRAIAIEVFIPCFAMRRFEDEKRRACPAYNPWL
jgi:hypothetical protein